MEEAVVLLVEDWRNSSFVTAHCRICHETEFESCMSFEAPCACSGTVQFAHRDCIQRWCDEKGNTICEICLQKYEPGYRVPPPKPKESELIDAAVTIRDSLEIVPRREHDLESQELLEEAAAECNSAAVRRASQCRFLALMVTVILLVRHLFSLFNGDESVHDYPFTIVTLLILRTSGIVIPMYVVIRTITAIQKSIQKNIRHQYFDSDGSSSNSDDGEDEEIERQRLQPSV